MTCKYCGSHPCVCFKPLKSVAERRGDWTAAEIKALKNMYAEGCSRSEMGEVLGKMGEVLGKTRNAISGKIHRLMITRGTAANGKRFNQ